MKRRVIVFGSSKGIGAATAAVLDDEFEVIRVSRTEGDEIGDLRDRAFCDYLIDKYAGTVEFAVQSAGMISNDFWEVNELNYLVTGYLALAFYQKMPEGSVFLIINSGAWDAVYRPAGFDRIPYHISRAATMAVAEGLANAHQRDVRVIALNPGWTNTGFANKDKVFDIPPDQYETPTVERLPLRPQEVAETVLWLLKQPRHVHVTNMDLRNAVRPGLPPLWNIARGRLRDDVGIARNDHTVTENGDRYITGHKNYPVGKDTLRPFVRRSPFRVDPYRLIAASIDLLERIPFDERNQICLTSRPGASDPLYDGVGKLFDAGATVQESDYSVFNSEFTGTYFEEVYRRVSAASKYGIGRVRLMRMMPRSCYSIHRDGDIRYHFAIQTNPGCILVHMHGKPAHIPADGHLYLADTRMQHTASNTTTQERVHLVFCTYERD